MQIIRLEYPDGQGIFGSYLLDENGEEIGRRIELVARTISPVVSDRHEEFNAPYEEPFADQFIQGKHFLAYKTLEQLRKWIKPEEMKVFTDKGCKVLLLDVSDCLVGDHQIAYLKTDIVSQTDITSLFLNSKL